MRRLGWLLPLLAVGCLGNITSAPDNSDGTNPSGMPVKPPGTPPGNPPPGTPPGNPPPSPGAARNQCEGQKGEIPGPRLLRRLTSTELETTVRAVFAIDKAAWAGPSLPPDPASANGFSNNSDRLGVGPDHARELQDMAKKVAQIVTTDPNLTRVLPCAAQANEACAASYLDTYGLRLYRRPLTPAERTRYLTLHTKVRAKSDFRSWVYWATTAMLLSPHMIYRSEIGDAAGAGVYRLSQYEIATAVAYTYTGAPPAPELLQAAAGNRLNTPDLVESAARTLVYDPAGAARPAFRDIILRFTDQWLGLSPIMNLKKDARAFPDFGMPVQLSVAEETRRFMASVLFDDKGKPADLLLAPYTYVDSTLSRYYGWGNAPGTAFIRAMRPAGWGVGLLGQGSILAIAAGNLSTSPTKRGHLVRSRLLCQDVPPPPAVVGELPAPTEAETTRQRYEMLHLSADSCRPCHAMMDPIGFGLEHLDASGRFRAKEGRFDIDDRGSLRATSAGDLEFTGPTELAQAVARLPETSDCVAAFIASNAFGMDHHDTPCMVRVASDELRAGKLGIVDFYVKMSRAEHFRTRTP